jgi:hypothetical protein
MFIIIGNLSEQNSEPAHRPGGRRGQKVVTHLYIREFHFRRQGPDFPIGLFLGPFHSDSHCIQFRSKLQFLRIFRDNAHSESFPGDRTPDCKLIVKLLKGAVRRYAHT